MLVAYTETLRDVYIIGLPCAILGLLGALLIKNSKMQTKAEEEAAHQKAKEQAALEEGGAGVAAGDEKANGTRHDAERAEQEEEEAEAIGAVGPVPDGAVEGGVDAQVALANKEGKSPV